MVKLDEEIVQDLPTWIIDQEVFRGCVTHPLSVAVAKVVHNAKCEYPVCIECLERYQVAIEFTSRLLRDYPVEYLRFIREENIPACLVCSSPIIGYPLLLAVRPLGSD